MDPGALVSIEAKAFVPARDFELSKRFYQEIGFAVAWSADGLAYLHHGACAFLLQDFHAPGHAENFRMHLLVEDVDAWWRHVAAVARAFGIEVEPPADRPWGLRDFALKDPGGVLWRIGQNL